jgi:hypothetical protein
MKKLIALLFIVVLIVVCFCGCNMSVGWGNYSFKKVHVDTHSYHGCIEIEKWYDNATGIEVKTKDYGSLYLSEGTYTLIERVCPFCEEESLNNAEVE